MTVEAQQQTIGMGQRHQWDLADSAVRKRLIAVHDALAARLGRPPFDVEARRPRRPDLDVQRIGELEQMAVIGEAVQRLTEEVDALRLEVTALRNGGR